MVNNKLHITHKTAKSILNLTSQSCGDLLQAGCLSSGDGAILRSPEHSWMSDKTQKQATAKAAWVAISTSTCPKC